MLSSIPVSIKSAVMSQSKPKNAALIVIGNEILAGHTIEANIPFLAKELNNLGIPLSEVRIVPDLTEAIVAAVNACRKQYHYVFTTGGIGPTHDDITADSIAAAFETQCIEHPEAIARLEAYYKMQDVTLNESRRRMARMPADAQLIENPISSAPGFQMGNVFVMAGVPNIMQAMFKGITHRLVGGPPILMRIVLCKLFEGDIAPDLMAIQKQFPDIDIGSYPVFRSGTYSLKLVLRGTDKEKIALVSTAIQKMAEKHGDSHSQTTDIME